MNGPGDIRENEVINAWARHFAASPRRVNATHESDAELLRVEGMPGQLLAVTIDTVAEEIAQGLYRDPFTMGWVAVMASLSDLAAVGAEPVGLVMSATTSPGCGEDFVDGAAEGMEQACRACDTHILGGDVNSARDVSFTGCAIGTVPEKEAMTRRGCEPGDVIYGTGRFGVGNALALARLSGMPDAAFPEQAYRPRARVREAKVVRRFAKCCMDSSDGLLATLDQLMRLNGCGFRVDAEWDRLLDEHAAALCAGAQVPGWLLAAGPHGEFELVFAVARDRSRDFEATARAAGITPVRVGVMQDRAAITLETTRGEPVEVDVAEIRNMVQDPGSDARRLLDGYLSLARRWRIG